MAKSETTCFTENLGKMSEFSPGALFMCLGHNFGEKDSMEAMFEFPGLSQLSLSMCPRVCIHS